jgi:O-antigen/teichoic acid export membrane protein
MQIRFPNTGRFVKNTFTLTIGTSIAQIFPLLFYPILGRLFVPSDFGLLANLTAISSILAVLATGKYDDSILIVESNKDAVQIVSFILLISFLFLLILEGILQIFANQIGLLFNDTLVQKWIFICPITAFAVIIFNCYNEWCVRNKYFISLSWNKIVNSAAVILNKFFFGFFKLISSGLIFGDLLGRIISALVCILRALTSDRKEFTQLSFIRMRYLAKRYIEFPKFSLPAQLLSTLGVSLPIFIISSKFSNVEVGYYAMSIDAFLLPMTVISVSIKDVFRQQANEIFIKTGNCLNLYKKLLRYLIITGTICSLILYFILPDLFAFVMGSTWRISGEYCQILLPMMTLSFISMSLSGVLIIAEKLRVVLLWQIYFVTITVLSLLIGYLIFQDIKSTLLFFSIGRSSSYLLYIVLSYKFSKGNLQHVQSK